MKLERSVAPLPRATATRVRPRSALGLKYVQLDPGLDGDMLAPGDRIPLRNATRPVEFDDFFSQFDDDTRVAQRTALQGFGSALAGRGTSINTTIEGLVPFFTHLEPVMRNLSDPRTRLARLFGPAQRFAGELAPVAPVYAALFGNMATAFEALGRDPEALRLAIERSPATLEAGIQAFPIQRPFLADAEVLFRELDPAARALERELPGITTAVRQRHAGSQRRPALPSPHGRGLPLTRGPGREPQHAARPGRPRAHPGGRGAASGDGRALPDRLQLLDVLLDGHRQSISPSRCRAGTASACCCARMRHSPTATATRARRCRSTSPPPRTRRMPARPMARTWRDAAPPVLLAGRRRAGPRRLRDGPAGLHQPPDHGRPLQALGEGPRRQPRGGRPGAPRPGGPDIPLQGTRHRLAEGRQVSTATNPRRRGGRSPFAVGLVAWC